MPTNISHERMRWNTMSERQLLTRLGRITVAEKLENFILLARDRGCRNLYTAALNRAAELDLHSLGDRYQGQFGGWNRPRNRDIADHRVRPEIFGFEDLLPPDHNLDPIPEVKEEVKKPIRFIRIGGRS